MKDGITEARLVPCAINLLYFIDLGIILCNRAEPDYQSRQLS